MSGTHLKYPLEIVEIEEGVVFEDDQFTVTALQLDHGIYSVGYRIVEKDRPGSLLVDQLRKEGVQPGPLYKSLKNGESIRLDDGRTIDGKDYLSAPQKGRIITILGDTRVCDNALILADSADYLIHEATFSAEETEMASAYFHSTTVQAAETAKKARAKHLVLTHISSRYTLEDAERLKEESVSIFANTIMAEDLLSIKIPLYVQE